MNQEITGKINELRNDRLHGAGWLSRYAINILSFAIKESQANTIPDFICEIRIVAEEIMKARPSMISIANYVSQFLRQIVLASENQKQLDSLKNSAQTKGDELIKLSEESALKAAEHGAVMINDRDTVITCSYSSTVCKAFEIAKSKGVEYRVIIAESEYQGTAYGEISAMQLKQHRVPVTVIHDKDIKQHVSKANKALAGADCISAGGDLINGTPTYKLAQAAKAVKIPFYSICETAKFDIQNQRGKKTEVEPGFDEIPSDLITGIITEAGIIKPGQITSYAGFEKEDIKRC